MSQAFILVNSEVGAEERIRQALRSIDGVTEVFIVYGVYDIIMRVQAASVDSLKEIITTQIRQLPGIRSTLTMIVVNGTSG